MDPVPTGGFTLMGSPTVVADITSAGSDSQVAARLLDVDTAANTQTLVARGLWRPAITTGPQRQVFQLHPNGYKFVAGHVVKLELLPKDSGSIAANSYGRTSNNQMNVTIENLQLRLPTVESPGALGGLVQGPAEKVIPEGYEPARDFLPQSYVRPKGATPFRASLVVAYAPCGAPNETHGPPLAFPSCSPPDLASDYLTVGTQDANQNPARFIGFVRYRALVGVPSTLADEADARIVVALSDVRSQGDLSDYTGELSAEVSVRLTDRGSGPTADEPATTEDFAFPVTVPCADNAGPGGADCGITTTFDAVMPGSVPEGKRSVWELGDVRVYDGGLDGLASTNDNTLFARQGVFVP
jgi:hypothetical protein